MNNKSEAGRISKEVAAEQLEEFLDYYDLDPEDDETEEGDIRKLIESFAKKLKKAFYRGWFELEKDERGRLFINHHLRCALKDGTETLRYKPLNVRAKIAMRSGVTTTRKGEETTAKGDYEKIYALMASLAGIGEEKIRQIEGPDVGLIEGLGAIFLAV
jgi:hypothetical protein